MLTFNFQKISTFKMTTQLLISTLLTFGLTVCDDNDVEENEVVMAAPVATEYSYQVVVTNLTHAQPLSPIAVALHGDSKMWQIGEMASVALEKLAEGGDNKDFLALDTNLAISMSEGPVIPGSSVTLTITTEDVTATYLTVATMLVNTNDAFSGLTGVDISTLAVEQQKSWYLSVYDSGTESNDEAAGTIPGPADGGTGYDAMRNDINVVGYHSGVVSQDDGLSNSVLTQAHRFDNPAVKLTITRTK
jgi:hypothetical protein